MKCLSKHPALGASRDVKMPTHLCKAASLMWARIIVSVGLNGHSHSTESSAVAPLSQELLLPLPYSQSQPPPTGTSCLTQMSAVLSDSTWFFFLSTHRPDIPDILRCAVPFPGSMVNYGAQRRVETIWWNLPPQQSCSGQQPLLSNRISFGPALRQLNRSPPFWTSVVFVDLMQEVQYNV